MTGQSRGAAVVARRRAVLRALSEPMTKPELVGALESSRSTIDRAVSALREEQLVRKEGSRYSRTFAGREALAAYERFLDRFERLQAAQPVLEELDPAIEVDADVLDGATILAASQEAPLRPVEHGFSRIDGAETFQGIGPTVIPAYIDLIMALLEAGADVELLFTEQVVDALTADYADGFADLREAENLAVFVTDAPLTTSVWTAWKPAETVSGLVTYAETGVRGIVTNNSEAMTDWATDVYETYRADARRLD